MRLRKILLHHHHHHHHRNRFLFVWLNVCFILSSLEPRWPLHLEALLVGCSLQAVTRQHSVGRPRNALGGRGAEVRAGSHSVYPEASHAWNRVWPILLAVLIKTELLTGPLMFPLLHSKPLAVCVWGMPSSTWSLASLHPCPWANSFLISPCAGSPASHSPRLPPPGFSVSLQHSTPFGHFMTLYCDLPFSREVRIFFLSQTFWNFTTCLSPWQRLILLFIVLFCNLVFSDFFLLSRLTFHHGFHQRALFLFLERSFLMVF